MERLADLDELILRCRTEESRSYISEAIASYRSGAYRACIVGAWIAIVFDLVDKTKELSISGDAQAQQVTADLGKLQDQLNLGNKSAIDKILRFEREILEIARDKFQLIDQQQFTDLDRIREDRNRCAHPTFQRTEAPYQPSGELARTHLRNAIVHVLQQAPVQGKAALNELRSRVESAYFPVDRTQAKANLQESALAKPTEALVRGFIDQLLYGFFTQGNSYHNKRRVVSALQACLDLHRAIAEPRLTQQIRKIAGKLDDSGLYGLTALLSQIPECWGAVQGSDRERLKEYIRRGPFEEVGKVLQYALKLPELADAARGRINTLSMAELATVLERTATAEAVDRAVEIYTNVQSWNDANAATDKIILPLLPYFTKSHIEVVIRSPMENGADLRGSGGFNRFLEKIRSDKLIPPNELDEMLIKYGLEYYVPEPSE